MHSSLVWLLPLLACASASPRVVHEKRHVNTNHHWEKRARLDSRAVIPFRIGLTQSNLENGDAWLMDVSDPQSANYGKHWTAEEVIDAFKPSHETVKTVHDWLHEAGIHTDRQRLSHGLNWLEFDATAEEAKALLNAEYHVFGHRESSTQHLACDEYSVPSHVSPHIDFISPGVHFDAKVRGDTEESFDGEGNKLAKRGRHAKRGSPWGRHGGHHWPGPKPHWPPYHPHPGPNTNICNDSFVTPYCIRTLYDIPTDLTPAEGNSVGIVEYTPETFLQSDLDLFFKTYDPRAEGEAPKFDSIDGGFLYRGYNKTTAFEFLGEPSLDLQYAMSILYPQNVVLYQVGDLAEAENTTFNNFLDAIDGSYCTHGGIVKGFDAVYPDPFPGPHSYQGKADCGTYAPAKVISTSYGYGEWQLPASYERRQCQEYMKLGLLGTTFCFSSGDFGVAGDKGECLKPTLEPTNGVGKKGAFIPDFPATCPYVLSIGATQIINGTTNIAAKVAAGQQVEGAMELTTVNGLVGIDVPPGYNVIDKLIVSSAGGFSNVFPLPSYQKSAVSNYMAKYAPSYPGQYNNSGNARGFPDISSNGAWLSVVIDGTFSPIFGTSCASPTVAAILGLINGERLKAGKSSLGFINPTLYQNPQVMKDVTVGQNPGCGTVGFSAVEGWDPITGLGTPNFPEWLKLFMSL